MNNNKDVHSQFLLFVVVMFCKVTINTELAKTEPLLLGLIQSQFPACIW